MAFTDRKIKKRRSKGWTKADQAREDARVRRERKAEAAADTERRRKLDRMSKVEREAFLADEEAEKLKLDEKRKKEDDERRVARKEYRQEQVNDSRLVAGFLHSEIAAAVSWKEKDGRFEGDWLADPVEAIIGQGGFGEEIKVSKGIKLQVNLCLDCSNSMYHNNLSETAAAVAKTLYLALDIASKDLPDGSLGVDLWLWAKGESGKYVKHLNTEVWSDTRVETTDDNPLGAANGIPAGYYGWNGEDTWLYPLLEELEEWEDTNVSPGAYRLDLIITDGVLEHPTDARKCDVIQERRVEQGVLQTVMMNFLPLEDWGDYRVPDRCVQYSVDVDNVYAVLISVLGSWLVGLM